MIINIIIIILTNSIKSIELDFSQSSCKNNPFLLLLPKDFQKTIKFTLSKNPKKRSLPFCKNVDKTCCTSFTFTNVKSYLKDHIYTPKKNIFNSNLNYYIDVLNEHKRNIVEGFKIKKNKYDDYFNNYKEKIKELVKIDEEIVKQSVLYNWDAFCNYICDFPKSLSYCNISADLFSVFNQNLYDYNFQCYNNENFLEHFSNLLKNFSIQLNKLNETIEEFYDKIFEVIDENKGIKNFDLLNKSLNDGLYVSKQINQYILCKQKNNVNIVNYYLNNNITNVNISCDYLLSNPCGLFDCLDGFFLQFYNINENNETILISQFNYSKINMIQNNQLDFSNNSKDFKDLVGNYLNFSKLLKQNYIKIKIYCFVIFLIIIF